MKNSSTTRTKIKKDFSQLLKLQNEEAKGQTLFSAQCISYKLVLKKRDADREFPLEWRDIEESSNNKYFDNLCQSYSRISHHYLQEAQKLDLEIIKATRNVVGSKGKAFRHAKKRSTRVFRAIKKHFNDKQYGTTDKTLSKALVSFHYAFRESFINVRIRMSAKIYDSVPSDFKVQLSSGRVVPFCELYTWDENRHCYCLSQDIGLSKVDMRDIQLSIVPIIYSAVGFPRGF